MTAKKTSIHGSKSKSTMVARSKKSGKSAAAHILSAPKGARIVSHRAIKEAVDKVFRERVKKSA